MFNFMSLPLSSPARLTEFSPAHSSSGFLLAKNRPNVKSPPAHEPAGSNSLFLSLLSYQKPLDIMEENRGKGEGVACLKKGDHRLNAIWIHSSGLVRGPAGHNS
jgi:hypothetical protein